MKSVNVHVAMEFEVGKGASIWKLWICTCVQEWYQIMANLEAESFNVWFHENYDALTQSGMNQCQDNVNGNYKSENITFSVE